MGEKHICCCCSVVFMFNVDINVDINFLTPFTTRTSSKVIIWEHTADVSARYYQTILEEFKGPVLLEVQWSENILRVASYQRAASGVLPRIPKSSSTPESTNSAPPVVFFTLTFCESKSWRSGNLRDIESTTPFRMFLFMTSSNMAARLLLGMSFKFIGGSGTTWIRQVDCNIVHSLIALIYVPWLRQQINICSPPRSRRWYWWPARPW